MGGATMPSTGSLGVVTTSHRRRFGGPGGSRLPPHRAPGAPPPGRCALVSVREPSSIPTKTYRLRALPSSRTSRGAWSESSEPPNSPHGFAGVEGEHRTAPISMPPSEVRGREVRACPAGHDPHAEARELDVQPVDGGKGIPHLQRHDSSDPLVHDTCTRVTRGELRPSGRRPCPDPRPRQPRSPGFQRTAVSSARRRGPAGLVELSDALAERLHHLDRTSASPGP